jgi:hypothetical protein
MKIQIVDRIAFKIATAMCCAMFSHLALAWSQEGHMVTGAIAFEELRAHHPEVVERIAQLMQQHPDRGTFEVAVGRSTGDARLRRTFMEMARWPDDIRRGVYDHPTWHYASKPVVYAPNPPPSAPPGIGGSAMEAFALNASLVADKRAPAAERAVALCWLFHLVGDIHQPLHAADRYSATHPEGDRGGNLQFILDPQSPTQGQPTSLHSYWDQAVNRSSDAAPARADELRTKLPRGRLTELTGATVRNGSADFGAWAAESYRLAESQAYADLPLTATDQQATALPAKYIANALTVAERQLTLSSYRLADLLVVLLRE